MPEELFFCLLLPLSLFGSFSSLPTPLIDVEKTAALQRGTVMERYRGHLILVRAHQEPDADDWSAIAHIQFNEENLTFRDIQLPGRTPHFPTKTKAEKQALKEAKVWVDERLDR